MATKLRYRPEPRLYFITRRCHGRQFRLNPSNKQAREDFLYCLAYALEKTNMKIVSLTVMSNHYHMIVEDIDKSSDVSRFSQMLNANIARVFNINQGGNGHFWECGSFSEKHLLTIEALVHRLIYMYVNPVKAGLVRTPEKWEGFNLKVAQIGNYAKTCHRPNSFGKNSKKPKTMKLKFSQPRLLETYEVSLKELQELVKKGLKTKIQEIYQTRKNLGLKQFLGMKKVKQQDVFDSPKATNKDSSGVKTQADIKAQARNEICPIQAEDKAARKRFEEQYRVAYQDWLDQKKPVFPLGTYKLRVIFNQPCLE